MCFIYYPLQKRFNSTANKSIGNLNEQKIEHREEEKKTNNRKKKNVSIQNTKIQQQQNTETL